jgi:maltose O-acetyltransferase
MYKKMGVKIGSNCKFQFDVVIDYSHYWLVEIGNNVTLAPRVHILAHDASTKQLFNYTRLGKVEIGNNVFIGAGSIILPGIKIGNNSIIGAGSVVSNSIPENSVAAGNPCKIICSIQEFESKRKEEFESSYKFDESYTLRGNITIEKKEEMIQKMNQTIFTYVI